MSTSAIERVVRTLQISANGGIASSTFGPPVPGRIRVFVSGRISGLVPGVMAAAAPGVAGPGALDFGMDAIVADLGLPGVGVPGGDSPDLLPEASITPSAFGLEVLDGSGSLRATGIGPRLELDLPSPRLPTRPAPEAASAGPPWTIRVTNNSSFDAEVTAHLEFRGLRPILSEAIDVTAASEELRNALTDPIEVTIYNDEVGEIVVMNRRIPVVHSHLVLANVDYLRTTLVGFFATQGITDVDLSRMSDAIDLEGRIFTENMTARITPDITIHDGNLALKGRLTFVGSLGSIDLIEALRAGGVGSGKRLLARIFVSLSGGIDRINKIHSIEADVFFVLRPVGFYGRPVRFGPHIDVIAKTRIDLGKRRVSQLVEGAVNVLLERFLPDALGETSGQIARRVLEGLLKRANPEVTGSEQHLTLLYAGDAPTPPVVVRG